MSDLSFDAFGVQPTIASFTLSEAVTQDAAFHFSDGNVNVLANKRRMFCVHRFKLEEFSRIKSKINTTLTLGFIELPDSPEDLHNTFMIIYSRFYTTTPPVFDTNILISALRIADLYDNPTLREFSIDALSLKKLSLMDYLPIAREFKIQCWEDFILDKLATRCEPVTLAEAQVLGINAFVLLATRRETNILEVDISPVDEATLTMPASNVSVPVIVHPPPVRVSTARAISTIGPHRKTSPTTVESGVRKTHMGSKGGMIEKIRRQSRGPSKSDIFSKLSHASP